MGQCGLYDRDQQTGRVEWHREGLFHVFRAECDSRDTLSRVMLLSDGGKTLSLGVMVPEGGRMSCVKRLSASSLAQMGIAPDAITRAELRASGEASEPSEASAQSGWRAGPPGPDMVSDTVLKEALRDSEELLFTKKEGKALLAVRHRPDRPCALAPAFCLLELRTVAGQPHYVLTLNEAGWPILSAPP